MNVPVERRDGGHRLAGDWAGIEPANTIAALVAARAVPETAEQIA